MQIIITSPSLDPTKNVGGISAVTKFIIDNNSEVEYVHFEQGRRDGERGGLWRTWTLIRSLSAWKKLLKTYPDAIDHYNFPLTVFGILRDTIFLHFAKGHKTVVHVHGGNYLMADRKPWIINALLKHLFRKDAQFIVLSELEKEKLVHDYNIRNISVLPNCPDLSDAKSFVREANATRPLTIGYLGRICKDKGMQELLDACIALKEQNIGFKLKIAGKEDSPEFIPKFRLCLEDKFEYCGVVSGVEKSEFLKSLDIFALPSYYEGLPMSLLESMSFGVAPVCTNVGSIGEVVKDGKNGLFVGEYSSQDIVTQISKLDADRDLLALLSACAVGTIMDNFNPDTYIQELNKIYTSKI